MSEMDSHLQIERTADGSLTVYNERIGQHYHSMYGAIPESEHVFIKEGLSRVSKSEIKVLEFGFGTGLNALLTLREALKRDLHIDYHGLELYPVPEAVWKDLAYPQLDLEPLSDSFVKMHSCAWEERSQIHPGFTLLKQQVDFRKVELQEKYDLIYFDAFGPAAQPELWGPEVFTPLYEAMAPGAVFTTYSCKGDVRRMLMGLGLKVEKVDGPPGKRSMLVGTKETS